MEITFNINNEVVEVILLIFGLLGALSVCFIVSDVFNFLRRKINKNKIMENNIEIGVDINNRKIFTGDRVKRDDGVIGRFNLLDFELCFDYEEEQEDGAICSYINHRRKYELL